MSDKKRLDEILNKEILVVDFRITNSKKNINEGKIQKQFFNKTFLFYILSMAPIVEATFVGISFTHKFGYLTFISCVVTELFALLVFFIIVKIRKTIFYF